MSSLLATGLLELGQPFQVTSRRIRHLRRQAEGRREAALRVVDAVPAHPIKCIGSLRHQRGKNLTSAIPPLLLLGSPDPANWVDMQGRERKEPPPPWGRLARP
eukprot:1974759-Pyramimonas_sp.AAC.1